MVNVYVYVMETMADWELAHVMAELHSKRFFKKDAKEIAVKTVGVTKNAVRSMGGLTITPDLALDEMEVSSENVLLLPGADTWSDPANFAVITKAKEMLEVGGLVTAICGATVALAMAGMLNDRPHTSNGVGFLDMFCPDYTGAKHYVDEPAVRDGNLITAAGSAGLFYAKTVLEYLDVMKADTLEHWYAYFSTGNAGEFFAMMQTLA